MKIQKNFYYIKRLLCLMLCLSLTLGSVCGCSHASLTSPAVTGDASADATALSFEAYTTKLFCDDVVCDTITLHYTLANPEAYHITDYPVTLGFVSGNTDAASLAALENIETSLKQYEKTDLSLSEQLTYDVILDSIYREYAFSAFPYYYELFGPTTGIQTQLPILLAEYRFSDSEDVEDYLKLLSDVPNYFSQALSYESEKADAGFFMSDKNADILIAQCRAYADAENSAYLFDTFDFRIDALSDLTETQKTQYKQQNSQLVTNTVLPAYEAVATGIEALKGSGDQTRGLSHLPMGKSYYELLVRTITGSELEIWDLEEMVASKRENDLEISTNLLTENIDLYAQMDSYSLAITKPEEMLSDLIEKMAEDFPSGPQTSFTVKTVDASLEEYLSPAFYLTTPIDDLSENSIYINPSYLCEGIELYTTLAHEGYPGHLYQNLYTKSGNLLPIRYLFSCGGYTEGWATYVEMLSYYYAGLDKDLATLLQKQRSILLSLYASLDMGIHYHGWSVEDCVDFLSDYGISDNKTITEIYQYIVMEPGNYLEYYIGYLEFLKLKEKAISHYGNDFSLSDFHRAILEMGPAPFYILEDYLFSYMDQ